LVDLERLPERLLAGERAALARAISWAENADPRFPAALARVWPRVGRAWRTGITGPPGAGKSTLVNELCSALRARDRSVGVLAVDPSSPFTGGALLGDRIRMEERTRDPGVFIRSMASRGGHGGLARAAVDACDVMDACGLEEIAIETVGVGQAEYEVVAAADSVLVVLCPGAGDGVQAMKAGILEVADVLVVNKSDLPGADRLALELEDALRFRADLRNGWRCPVVRVSAGQAQGLPELLVALDAHRAWLTEHGLEQLRRRRRATQVRRIVDAILARELWERAGAQAEVESALQGGATPYDVAQDLAARLRGGNQESTAP
jgi:LAO/AO transport system kinase